VRRPVLFLTAALIALHVDVFFMGHTVLPLMTGVTATGPYAYEGFRPDRHVSIDPAGALDAEFTWAAYFVRTIRSGSFPFWNPYQGLGQPQLANYVSAVLYPVNWLNLVLPPPWWDLIFFVDWFLAAYFVCLFVRALGLGREAAIVAGLAVYACGFFSGFLAVRSLMGTVPWFACLLYGIERTLVQPRWRWTAVVLGLGTYGLATGGHPEPALLGLVLAMMYFALRLIVVSPRVPALMAILPPMFFGGLLAAPVWIPFADYSLRDAMLVHHPGVGIAHFESTGVALTVFPFVYGPLNMGQVGGEVWVPAGVTFLACAGVALVVRRRAAALGALTVLALFSAAKIYGVPVINDIGRLPLLKQFWFNYANGFVSLAVAVLAGAGFAHLGREPVRRWVAPIAVWIVYAIVMLGIALEAMSGARPQAMMAAEPWRADFLRMMIAAGLFWALAFPAALLAIRVRHGDRRGPFVLVAVAGLLLQAFAYFPNGSSQGLTAVAVVAPLVFVVIAAGVLIVPRAPRALTAGVLAVSLTAVVVAATVTAIPRLPHRHNPLKPAPYVARLTREPNAPRIYPLEGWLFPNFATPFGLSSMTNLDNLAPRRSAMFSLEFLDSGAHPARFYGFDAARLPGASDALTEFWAHKRYWDLIGVRYLVAAAPDLNTRIVWAPAAGAPMAPVPVASPLESVVACATGPFDGVAVFLSTYGSVQPGRIALDALDTSGAAIATAAVDSSSIVNNADQMFQLSGHVCADGADRAVLRLRFEPGAPGAMIAGWRASGEAQPGFVFRTLYRQPASLGLLRPVSEDRAVGVRIWENPRAAPRAFLAPIVDVVSSPDQAFLRMHRTEDLQRVAYIEQAACRGDAAFPPGAAAGRLISIRIAANEVDLTYEARTAGVLTLTDAYADGWTATLNGRDESVLRVDGVFRGVCIDAPGEHRIVFRYRPPTWTAALGLAGVGALGLAALTVVAAGTRPRRSISRRDKVTRRDAETAERV
jgi:hypothetical protein